MSSYQGIFSMPNIDQGTKISGSNFVSEQVAIWCNCTPLCRYSSQVRKCVIYQIHCCSRIFYYSFLTGDIECLICKQAGCQNLTKMNPVAGKHLTWCLDCYSPVFNSTVCAGKLQTLTSETLWLTASS